ncbi:MAG: anti-sigma factor RsiW [Bradymonadia bacterium]|jgi:anti-sigma factor RsiW
MSDEPTSVAMRLMKRMMYSCDDVVDLLIDYLEDDLSTLRKLNVKLHLANCPKCEEFIAQYRKTSVICRDELARTMPSDLEARLVAALEDSARAAAHE